MYARAVPLAENLMSAAWRSMNGVRLVCHEVMLCPSSPQSSFFDLPAYMRRISRRLVRIPVLPAKRNRNEGIFVRNLRGEECGERAKYSPAYLGSVGPATSAQTRFAFVRSGSPGAFGTAWNLEVHRNDTLCCTRFPRNALTSATALHFPAGQFEERS